MRSDCNDTLLNTAAVQSDGEDLLRRAKGTANEITDRVRQALGYESFAPGRVEELRPLRVLCVDDYPDAADALAALLQILGCEVRTCYASWAAVDVVREFQPDVCVLDLSMPILDGVQLSAVLRSEAGRRPLFLVAATALGSLEVRTITAIAGFHYHLVKPIEIDKLRLMVGEVRSRMRPPASPGAVCADPT